MSNLINNTLVIAGRKVGVNFPPLVVAEIGINHGGSLLVAKQMVDAAKRAGCEIIKHQTHIIEDEMIAAAKNVIPGNADVSIYDIIRQCALNEEDERALQQYVLSQGMIFFSTPFSKAAADRLHKMDIPLYKIGSGECNNYPLIEYIASFSKPMILSTGMNSIESIAVAVKILRKNSVPFGLMHCTSIYPTPYDKIRYGAMLELNKNFPDAVIGLSDHSVSNYPCLGAVALGASLLERHFTDTKERIGPDIPVSMDETELRILIEGSKAIFACRGGNKQVLAEEQPTIDFAYASIVTITDIKPGDILNENNIWVKRPGTGPIRAQHFNEILGKTATRSIAKDNFVEWNMFQ